MDRRQTEIIIAPVVVVIAVIFVIATAMKVSKKQSSPAADLQESPIIISPEIASPASLSGRAGEMPATDVKNAESYNIESSSWGRDPFVLDKASLLTPGVDQDKAAKIEQLTKLKLTGMIMSDENPRESIAVINGENLKIGDSVSGFVLKEIKQNSVLLEWNNEDFELKLWEEEAEKKEQPIKQQ